MSSCTTCAHNGECIGYRAATVTECDNYTPRCMACAFWKPMKFSTEGQCDYMLSYTCSEDYCSLGEAQNVLQR